MDVPRRRGHWVEKEATLIDPAVGSIPGVDRGRSGFGRIDSSDIFGRRKKNQFEIVLKYVFKEAFPNRFPLENLRNPFRQLVPHRFPAFPSRNTVRNILKVEKFPQTKICQKSQIFVYNSGSNSGLLRPKNQFRGCSQKNPHQKEPNPPKRLKNQTQEKKNKSKEKKTRRKYAAR